VKKKESDFRMECKHQEIVKNSAVTLHSQKQFVGKKKKKFTAVNKL
jgi:hypothetical protein